MEGRGRQAGVREEKCRPIPIRLACNLVWGKSALYGTISRVSSVGMSAY